MIDDFGLGRADVQDVMRAARAQNKEVELPLAGMTHDLATCVAHDHRDVEHHSMVGSVVDRFVAHSGEVGVLLGFLLVDLVHGLVVRDQVAFDGDRVELGAKRSRQPDCRRQRPPRTI